MLTKLDRIAEIAKEKPKEKFTSLAHLINEEMLKMCHEELDRNKATGVDKITKDEYGTNLDDNIKDLLNRMKAHKYKPQPVRRVYIPKDDKGKVRPIGIPTYEDKIVQMALNKIINAIYEQDFLDCSFGFRPNRGCHDAIKILDVYLSRRNIQYVVDADIKGFFDHVDHKWMLKFLEHRIKDLNIIRLIGRFLKAGIMEKGAYHKIYEGTPQGGIISPTLGNIYLHYVLDLWFEKVVKMHCKGKAYLVRYADDTVACFELEEDANAYYKALVNRLSKFNLQIAEDKTKIIRFGRIVYDEYKNGKAPKPPTFDFLGFTHYCGCRKDGSFRVKRKTSAKKFRNSLKRCKIWLKKNRILPVDEVMKKLSVKLQGYYRYYGITDNIYNISNFRDKVSRLLFKWLNRRSQKRSFNWEKYNLFRKRCRLPRTKIYVNIFELNENISYIL